MKLNALIILIMTLSFGSYSLAAISEVNDEPATRQAEQTEVDTSVAAAPDVIKGNDAIEVQETVLPESEAINLRQPSLGDAFKNFTPSEEISADNAVPFPVDI